MSEFPPTSQQMQRKAQAECGTKQQKKELKQVCGHCYSGPGAGRDLHPGGVWVKCGEKGCRSSNFNFHAKCHGISIVKEQAKAFCEKFLRCPAHVNQGQLNLGHLVNDLASSDEDVADSDSDIDFQPNKQMKKRKKKQESLAQKRKVMVCSTPGSYTLGQLDTDSSDKETEQSQKINSSEKLDTGKDINTDDDFDNKNAAEVEDHASKFKSVQAKGLVDREQIIPSGSLKVKNSLKTVKKFTAPIGTLRKSEQIENPEFQKVFKSKLKQKPEQPRVTKPKIKLASYLKDLDAIWY